MGHCNRRQYEVFLGGSCNPTTWRMDVAMPTLDSMGITYFNPQVKDWSPDLIEIEHKAKQSARVLFFVLDADTRAAASAVEAAHLAGSARSRSLVLVLQPYRRGQSIGGELVSDQEYLDLKRGRDILREVAEARDLLVFDDVESALRCTYGLLRGNDPFYLVPELSAEIMNCNDTKLAIKLKQNTTENISSEEESTNDTQNSVYLSKSNKSNRRKLSVIIPKVMDEVDSDSKSSVFTPETERRLNSLAKSVRDEITCHNVYLGGACVNQTNWRENLVVPLLKNHNISYCIPKINDFNGMWYEMQDVEYPLNTSNRLSAADCYKIPEGASPRPFTGMYDEKLLRNSRVLFFGLTKDTRCLAPMALAAHCIGLRPRAVVLCVQLLNQTEDVSEQAAKDYNRGRMYLSDLAKREGVPIFDNLEEATQCVIEKLKNGNY